MTSTRTHDDDARDLRLLMDQALADATPSTTLLGERAAGTGRLVRRRRRLAIGSAAAVVALGAGWAVPYLAGGAAGTGAVATDPGSATPSAATVTPDPDWRPDNPGWWSMPTSQMAGTLRTLLPDGAALGSFERTNVDRAPGEPLHEMVGFLEAGLTSPDGRRGAVNIMLTPPPTALDRLGCPGNLVAPTTCRELVDGSGRHYGRTSVWSDAGITIYEVTLRTADHGLVYGATANTADDKWGVGSVPTADAPPLTREQLRDLVEAGVWTAYVPTD